MSTGVFSQIYTQDVVDRFFEFLYKKASKERIDMFIKYHTIDVLNNFMGLWPPPYITEVWDRWTRLPAHKQYVYEEPVCTSSQDY